MNNSPFYSLEERLDLSTLPAIHNEVCWALAKHPHTYMRSAAIFYGRAALDLYDGRFKEAATAEAEMTPEEHAVWAVMDAEQRGRYLMITHGAYYSWGLCQTIYKLVPWEDNTKEHGVLAQPEFADAYKTLISFSETCGVFKTVGRIVIFGSLPGQHAVAHRDATPDEFGPNQNFITLCPKGKRFFIYDAETKQKHYTESTCFMFNDLDYHGVDADTRFTYSVRIDGQFTDEFLATINYGR